MKKRALRWYDYITVNIYFLGLSVNNQTFLPLVLPLLIQQFVGEAQQGTYFGVLRLWGLMVALLAQALWGILSDRTRLRWGRRRPFVLFGTLGDLVFVAAIMLSINMEGMAGFWFLFVMYLGFQIASNAAQAGEQGLIPDLIPAEKRGRFSGAKAFFEVPLPVLLVSFTIAPLIGSGNMLGGLLVMSGVLVFSMLVTMFVPEQPLEETPAPLNWEPFARLVLMTAIFTAIILGMREAVLGVGKLVGEQRSAAIAARHGDGRGWPARHGHLHRPGRLGQRARLHRHSARRRSALLYVVGDQPAGLSSQRHKPLRLHPLFHPDAPGPHARDRRQADQPCYAGRGHLVAALSAAQRLALR